VTLCRFLIRCLFYDVRRLFPGGRAYGVRVFGLPPNTAAYRCVLSCGRRTFGAAGVVLANLTLSLFFFPLAILWDFLWSPRLPAGILTILGGAVWTVFLAGKFDALRERGSIGYLKLAYLLIALCLHHYVGLTYCFLAVLENLILLSV